MGSPACFASLKVAAVFTLLCPFFDVTLLQRDSDLRGSTVHQWLQKNADNKTIDANPRGLRVIMDASYEIEYQKLITTAAR